MKSRSEQKTRRELTKLQVGSLESDRYASGKIAKEA